MTDYFCGYLPSRCVMEYLDHALGLRPAAPTLLPRGKPQPLPVLPLAGPWALAVQCRRALISLQR